MIELGDQVKDQITGFTGIVMGITEWINQCRRIGVQSQKLNKDGTPVEVQWFDEVLMIKIKQFFKAKEDKEYKNPGGPLSSQPNRNKDFHLSSQPNRNKDFHY